MQKCYRKRKKLPLTLTRKEQSFKHFNILIYLSGICIAKPSWSHTSQIKTSIILNAAFRGNTEANSVKNHDDAYIAVWKPYDKGKRD